MYEPAQRQFGYPVAISGDTVVVSQYGGVSQVVANQAAFVFERHSGGLNGWEQVAKLTGNSSDK